MAPNARGRRSYVSPALHAEVFVGGRVGVCRRLAPVCVEGLQDKLDPGRNDAKRYGPDPKDAGPDGTISPVDAGVRKTDTRATLRASRLNP
jgi:hypothetical protein